MKSIYQFDVEHDGKKYEFMVARPTRRQIQECEIEYAAEYSKCMRLGILNKEMLTKHYEEAGGVMTKAQAKKLSDKYSEFNEINAEITRLSTGPDSLKKNKEKLKELEKKFTNLRREIADMESASSEAYQNTADSKAQARSSIWYSFNLTMIKNEKGEWEPYFKGNTTEEKEEFYYEKEDSDDMVYWKAITMVGAIVSIWNYNKGLTEEGLKKLLIDFGVLDKEEEAEEEVEEESTPKKVAKKVAKKKAEESDG